MGPPRWLRFVERLFPSSNMVVIAGDKPVLVDTGYGSDLARTEGLLAERGIGPAERRAAGGQRPAQPAPPDWQPAYPWPGNWPSTKAAEEGPTGSGHKD